MNRYHNKKKINFYLILHEIFFLFFLPKELFIQKELLLLFLYVIFFTLSAFLLYKHRLFLFIFDLKIFFIYGQSESDKKKKIN
jgi:hypothetical protein